MAGSRALVSRARADMRSMATALEAYWVDHRAYPAGTASPEWQIRPGVLTTPVAYLTADFADVFKLRRFLLPRFPALPFLGPLMLVIGFVLTLAALLTAVHLFVNMAIRRGRGGVQSYRDLFRLYAICAMFSALFACFFFPPGFLSGPDVRMVPNVDWRNRPDRFNYVTDGTSSWLLQSLGPDGDRDLEDLSTVNLDGPLQSVLSRLAPFAYDPTNGSLSSGDLFRISD